MFQPKDLGVRPRISRRLEPDLYLLGVPWVIFHSKLGLIIIFPGKVLCISELAFTQSPSVSSRVVPRESHSSR